LSARGDLEAWLIKIAAPLRATITINPSVWNLRSFTRFVSVYIDLPGGYSPSAISLSSVSMNGVPAITDPRYDFVSNPRVYLVDIDRDGVLERLVKFDALALRSAVRPTGGRATLTLTGTVSDVLFHGSATVRVLFGP
jgi:hypothetical protein